MSEKFTVNPKMSPIRTGQVLFNLGTSDKAHELRDRLKVIAKENGIGMSDVVVQMLEYCMLDLD